MQEHSVLATLSTWATNRDSSVASGVGVALVWRFTKGIVVVVVLVVTVVVAVAWITLVDTEVVVVTMVDVVVVRSGYLDEQKLIAGA